MDSWTRLIWASCIRRSYYRSNGVGTEPSRLAEVSQLESLLPQKNLMQYTRLSWGSQPRQRAMADEAALWANLPLATKKIAGAEEPATVEEHTAAEGAVATEVCEVEEEVAMGNGVGN
jgi:hypothetical protein